MSPSGSPSVTNMLAPFVRCMFAFTYRENKFMLLQMMGFDLRDGTGLAKSKKEVQKDKTRTGMVSSNWVGYIVCNTL